MQNQENRNIDKLKNKCKELGQAIRQLRPKHKEAQRNGTYQESLVTLSNLKDVQYEARHHHIAYCELRGRVREQIERIVRDDNHPNEMYISQLKERYAWSEEEIKWYEEMLEKKNEKTLSVAQD